MSEFVGLIERLAGQKAFENGVVLFLDKAVESLVVKDNQAQAIVQTPHPYSVKLVMTSSSIEGACSCPISEEFDFCEHCVAVALAYNRQQTELKKLQEGPPEARVEAYIKQMTEAECRKTLINVIHQDKDLLVKWVLLADASSGQLKANDIKKRITKALPLKSISQASIVQEYFENALSKLEIVFEVLPLLEPKQAFACAEYLMFRYDTVLSRVDDSNGARHAFFMKIEPLFMNSFKALKWSIEEKVNYLMGIYVSEYAHFEFTDLPQRFIDPADTKLMAAFGKALESSIKASGLKRRKATGKLESTSRDMLCSIAYCYAQRQKFDVALKYLEQAADSVEGYCRLIEFCFDNELLDSTAKYIEEATALATTAYEKRVVSLLAKRLI